MKTSNIIRRLAAASIFTGEASLNFPVITNCSSFVPFSEEIVCTHFERIKRSHRNYNYHRYYCGKDSSEKSKTATHQSDVTTNTEIPKRNFDIIRNQAFDRALRWESYLHLTHLLLLHLQDQLESASNNKRVAVELKKLKRSFSDSLEAYEQFRRTTHITPEMVPTEPLNEYIKCDYPKKAQKLAYRDYDKRLTKTRKRDRQNKIAERNFWISQWEIKKEEEIMEKAEQYVYDYERYSNLNENLLNAEKALQSPCIEEAAWAIHTGMIENNADLIVEKADIIEKANKLIDNYLKALNEYEICIGLEGYPPEN